MVAPVSSFPPFCGLCLMLRLLVTDLLVTDLLVTDMLVTEPVHGSCAHRCMLSQFRV